MIILGLIGIVCILAIYGWFDMMRQIKNMVDDLDL